MADAKAVRKATSPKFRASFPWLFEPQPPMEGSVGEPKYSVVMLFDKAAQATPEFKAMKKLAEAALKDKWGDKPPSNLRNPFRSGTEKPEMEGYGEGVIFVSASSKMQPGVVDGALRPIMSRNIEPAGFYAGCYARATVVAYAYDKAGNKGVAFGLNNVQKLGDGEAFSGMVRAEDDFGAVEDVFGGGDGDDDGGGKKSFLD